MTVFMVDYYQTSLGSIYLLEKVFSFFLIKNTNSWILYFVDVGIIISLLQNNTYIIILFKTCLNILEWKKLNKQLIY